MLMQEQGFNYLEEKGLFTFYKEQEESNKKQTVSPYRINLRRQKSNDSYQKNKVYPEDKINIQNRVLHTFISLDENGSAINSRKKQSNNANTQKVVTHKTANMNMSHSSKRAQLKLKNIVQLNFQAITARRQVFRKPQYILRTRAKTQANQIENSPKPSPQKIQYKPSPRIYSKLQNNYFSQKVQRHSPKRSSIFFRLKKREGILQRIKSSNKNIKTFLTTQPPQMMNQNLVVKGIQDKDYQQRNISVEIRKAELLPQLAKDKEKSGSTIDFWEYFQERKIFFLNRYKKAKANKMHQIKHKQKKKSQYQT